MIQSVLPLLIGFIIDLIVGDPHEIPHPVAGIGKLIASLEPILRRVFPKSPKGETLAGGILWLIVTAFTTSLSWGILRLCVMIHPALHIAVESVMCWQIIAIRSLRDESMKVYSKLTQGDLQGARRAVSMIVGRDTAELNDKDITRAAVETIAENTADGIVAPLLFISLGGAPFGFFYKAINTMDSMLGYIDSPYTNFGKIPAKMDDIANFIPSRLTALLMLFVGMLQKLDLKNGIKIFIRDRYKHASPNSAQTESVCAGLLRIRLAGDAWYRGILHKKQFIGDPLREIEYEDIPLCCRLMYGTSAAMLMISCMIRIMLLH